MDTYSPSRASNTDDVLSPSLHLPPQVEHTYTGPLDDELGEAMLTCDPEVHHLIAVDPLIVNLNWF